MKSAVYYLLLPLGACSPESPNSVSNSTTMAVVNVAGDEAKAGPFGYAFGQDVTKTNLKPSDKPGYYETASPPIPHSDFNSVVVEAYSGIGICRIRGVGRDIENDGAGIAIRSKVDEISQALSTKYGAGKLVDLCNGTDIGCQPPYCMMSLYNRERLYGYAWDTATSQMTAYNIGTIVVTAAGLSTNTAYPIVEYYSATKAACEAAQKDILTRGL